VLPSLANKRIHSFIAIGLNDWSTFQLSQRQITTRYWTLLVLVHNDLGVKCFSYTAEAVTLAKLVTSS